MALNDLEDRLESAIRHINTALDIDPWAQILAVESIRMRIAMMKTGQPDIIRCKDCKWKNKHNCMRAVEIWIDDDKFCAWAERRTDDGERKKNDDGTCRYNQRRNQ